MAEIWSSPAYFNHHDLLPAEQLRDARLQLEQWGDGHDAGGLLDASESGSSTAGPVISANGTNNGMAWMIDGAAFGSSGPDILYAFNATNISQMLYNSDQNLTRDNPGGAMKMTTPTVSGGKVYVGAQYSIVTSMASRCFWTRH